MFDQCWSTVYEVGPVLVKHWVNVSCLQGYSDFHEALKSSLSTSENSKGTLPYIYNTVIYFDEPLYVLSQGVDSDYNSEYKMAGEQHFYSDSDGSFIQRLQDNIIMM